MKEIKVLMLANLLCVAAMMAFLSVVGPIIRQLHLEEWHAGLTVAIAGVVWVVLARYWGKKSDMIGRKPILIIGVGGVAVFYFLMAIYVDFAIISPPAVILSLGALIVTRGAIGAFYAAITPVSNALIADHIEEEKRTSYISKLAATNGLGMVLGPIAGGFLAGISIATTLYTFAILPFIGAIILLFALPKEKARHHKEEHTTVKIFDKRLRLPMIAAFLTMFSIVSAQVCIGFFIIDRLGADLIESAKIAGTVLSIVGVVFIISQVAVSKMSLTPKELLKYGSILAFLGYIIVAISVTQLVLSIGLAVSSFGLGMIFPAFQTLAVNLVSKKEQGAASGTVSSAQGLGIIVGPLISTFLYEINPILPFIGIAVAFASLFIITLLGKKD